MMMVDVSELFHFVMQRKAGIIFQPNLFLGGVWPPRCQATLVGNCPGILHEWPDT
jgi:hypothetical protein